MNARTIALVTGVSSGIGRETAQLLVERGARVFGTVRDLRRRNPIAQVKLVRMDVTDETSVMKAVNSVLEKAGKIDILVNNAGYSLAGGVEETSVEEAQEGFNSMVPPAMDGQAREVFAKNDSVKSFSPEEFGIIRSSYRSRVECAYIYSEYNCYEAPD
jgi:NAD(P)-dependent dehydrogenase (short-subunit alcohol dehydrogenase family)